MEVKFVAVFGGPGNSDLLQFVGTCNISLTQNKPLQPIMRRFLCRVDPVYHEVRIEPGGSNSGLSATLREMFTWL